MKAVKVFPNGMPHKLCDITNVSKFSESLDFEIL